MPAVESKSIDEELDHRRMQQELALLFEKMNLKERTALILHYLHGYSTNEIAEMTDTGVLTVRGRLRNGKKKLKKLVLRNETLADWISVSQ